MNIPKKYVGMYAEITWRDPNYYRGEVANLVRGKEALATWKEYGMIYDVTDGVVLVAHSLAQNVSGSAPGQFDPDEIARTAIHEALIEKLVIYTPQQEESQ
jgi:hypothetical protein